jgi:hypothetical protein
MAFELDAQIEATEEAEEKPRRYEIVNAETGEPVQGVSFILTPTGEEMHLLTEPGHYVGPMQDIGVYYHGHLTNEPVGADSLPAIRPMALYWMASRIMRELARIEDRPSGRPEHHYGNMQEIRHLGDEAYKIWERYREENAEFVAEKEREAKERREHYRKIASGQTEGN